MIRALVRPLAQSIVRALTDVSAGGAPAIAVPGAPTGVSAVASNAQATVSFTAPASIGGGPITGYRVTASTGQTATGAASPIIVTGLTNGAAVTFTVAAQNAGGYGAESTASASVTPTASLLNADGTFASATGWTATAPWSIGSGVASWADAATGTPDLKASLSSAQAAGTFRVTYSVTAFNDTSGGLLRINVFLRSGATNVANAIANGTPNTTGTGVGAQSVDIVTGGSIDTIAFTKQTNGTGSLSIDNVTITKIA